MQCKGVVKGSTVVLEEGAHLPEGARVTVTLEEAKLAEMDEITHAELAERRALVAQMKVFGQRLVGRRVNLGDLILEGREELEERA